MPSLPSWLISPGNMLALALAHAVLALALLQGARVRPPVAARAARTAVAPRLAAATGIEQIEQLSVALEAGTPAEEAVPQLFPFPLDEFQLASLRALEAERSVVVSAPTGSGKTVIAEVLSAFRLTRHLPHTPPPHLPPPSAQIDPPAPQIDRSPR